MNRKQTHVSISFESGIQIKTLVKTKNTQNQTRKLSEKKKKIWSAKTINMQRKRVNIKFGKWGTKQKIFLRQKKKK